MCLEDGEPLGTEDGEPLGTDGTGAGDGMRGFVLAASCSMMFVPLLSWYDDDSGSIGCLSRLNPPEVEPSTVNPKP